MEKILKKYTTIPEHLYVHRSADFQLRGIIEEMQRPGYVLVARQMGKTNLLFNAKRTLENENRRFVYVDLSNLFVNEIDCYRNIIDNIIEPNIDLFESIESKIEEIRHKNLPPHSEYSRCLRVVLDFFKGDLVIILDEIDALKSINYSDNIFAQIRSNYFSRTNFPVFERLTYVLSGVIEPTELIKDKNKSPFNIGDKIYLDDFTIDEHNDFIKKSKLKISKELSNEIFSWANGNPRLTFDICSEIENAILGQEDISIDQLNEIVKKKYLTNFDIAPIDHIRELVIGNREIRKSIEQIHRQSLSKLNDEIKKKLYLYGIINSKFNEPPKIKNRIIEQTLSQSWIKSIDSEKEISLVYALAKYHANLYEEAIEILQLVLKDDKSNKGDVEAAKYFIGRSYLKMQNYHKAIDYLASEFTNESYRIDAESYMGISKIAIGQKEEGIIILEKSIKNEVNSHAYYNAVLNLAINLDDQDQAYLLFEKLFQSTFTSNTENLEELNQLRPLASYYQANILLKNGQKEKALEKIDMGIECSNFSDSLFLKYLKYNWETEKDEAIKSDLVNTIVDNNLQLDPNNSPIAFTENLLIHYLDFTYKEGDVALFERLLDYSSTALLTKLNKYELIFLASQVSTEHKEALIDYLLKLERSIPRELLSEVYSSKANLNLKDKTIFFTYFDKYLSLFHEKDPIGVNDIYLFALAVKFNSDLKNYKTAIELCDIIERKIHGIEDEELKSESVIIYYWYSVLYFSLKDRAKTINYVNQALDLIQNSSRENTSMIDEKGLKSITEQLVRIKKSANINIPMVHSKKYGRNDKVKVRYLDGSTLEKKYKQVEADILAERCAIVTK